VLPLLAALGAGVAAYATRAAVARRHHRAVAARMPVGPSGIIPGAEPFTLPARGHPGDGPAVLMLHGFGDTPQTLRYLGGALHAAGWTVRVPLLPGHGRTLAEFGRSDAAAWLAHAREELAALRAQHREVALAGLSMGGALASVLAAETPDVRALALLAPYLSMPTTVRRLARVHRLLELAMPWAASRGERSIHDEREAARSLSYGVVAPHLLRELLRVTETAQQALPRITAPTLVIYSRQDNRVPVDAAEREYAKLRAPERELVWLERCGHLVTVDHEHREVSARVAAFLARHVAQQADRTRAVTG
jgi:carboxylesterase